MREASNEYLQHMFACYIYASCAGTAAHRHNNRIIIKHMFAWEKIINIKKSIENGVLSIVLSISSVAKALFRL